MKKIAAFYVTALIGFLIGAILIFNKLWPYSTFADISKFVAGDPTEKTSVIQKLKSDLGLEPTRYLHPFAEPKVPPLASYQEINVEEQEHAFSSRRALPLYFSQMKSGAWLVNGIYDFESGLHGFLLINHEGKVLRSWQLTPEDLGLDRSQSNRVSGLGLEVMSDGSIISRVSDQLFRMSWCGELQWNKNGRYHHSVAADGNGGVWTWRDDFLVLLSATDGSLQKEIHIEEIIRENPDISAFEILTKPDDWKWSDQTKNTKLYASSQGEESIYLQDPFHQNDVEPLLASQAQAYEELEAGDLLVSMRHLNLVFVVRPSSRKVVWFRQGITSRQHDPDWNERGTITVFDNRNHHRFSHIKELDMQENYAKTLVDGGQFGIYTAAGGSHQNLLDKGIAMVSRDQGRLTYVSLDGTVLFDLINRYDDSRVLRLFNARFISEERMKKWDICSN